MCGKFFKPVEFGRFDIPFGLFHCFGIFGFEVVSVPHTAVIQTVQIPIIFRFSQCLGL
jgi:hypothetical protein